MHDPVARFLPGSQVSARRIHSEIAEHDVSMQILVPTASGQIVRFLLGSAIESVGVTQVVRRRRVQSSHARFSGAIGARILRDLWR
jgi:hypothetical protein